MPEAARQLHDDWKMANEIARIAEEQIASMWEIYFAGNGTAPSDEDFCRVKRLRDEASHRLDVLIRYFPKSSTRL